MGNVLLAGLWLVSDRHVEANPARGCVDSLLSGQVNQGVVPLK